mmetsp:Transcript_23583/g.54892  ORF Transcript_23583/g.54892 Transcript_23583/m.54892 type:complete len:83 (-) Transcript_23583:1822-2070(-)
MMGVAPLGDMCGLPAPKGSRRCTDASRVGLGQEFRKSGDEACITTDRAGNCAVDSGGIAGGAAIDDAAEAGCELGAKHEVAI